jgi:choice-of-anchor C domain-containing protein
MNKSRQTGGRLGLTVAGLLAAGMTLLGGAPGPNLIVNGGFEALQPGGGYVPYMAGTDLGGWRVEKGSVEAVGTYWQAAEGSVSLDLSGLWDWVGTIAQDVPTVPGHQYRLSFMLAGNPESQEDYLKKARVWWSGAELATLEVDVRGRSFSDMGWRRYEYVVTATAATTTVKFESLTYNFLGPTLDDVQLADITPSGEEGLRPDLYLGVQLTGKVGGAYRVEFREDMVQEWKPLTNVVLTASPMLWVDPIPARNTQRLYRTVELK